MTASGFLSFLAVKYKAYWLMLISRLIAGLCIEVLVVTQNTMSQKWFTGKFIGLAMSLNTELMLGSMAISGWLGPELYLSTRNILVVILV